MTDQHEARGPREASASGAFAIVGAHSDAEWMDVLARSYQHDFHHLAGYHRLAEHRGEGTALLFVHRESEYMIALPLLLRPVDENDPAGPQDATSVYGYCGPVASHVRVPEQTVFAFQTALRSELVRRRVVAVFSRLHPLIAQREILARLGKIRRVGPTVSIDLTVPLDDQWAGYSKKWRRIIRKAQDAGVVCIHDRERVYRKDWVEIYRETMLRVGAPPSYRFDEEYFELLAAELGPVLHLFVALVDGKTAAAGLFTICDGIVQAHLGGFRHEYSKLSPVRLVDDAARRWAAENGARVFHLGGGVGGHEDSLFQYKAGFSDRRHEFATWQWVIDAAAYRELCSSRGVDPGDEGYFPAYRQPLESGEPGT